ncbi:hypothetical protein ACFVH9_08320 [Streptomyces hirsutus]|uniref:hypothetical protein n=1 Tax=Streptomyces hirsutus TaxID=35620 RepID=UPI00362DD5AE
MTNQTSPRPAYRLPASDVLGAAVDEALNGATTAHERLGRVMAVVTAAAVRDILTGCDHDAPFDAAKVELVEGEDGLFPTGRYWTAAGDERTFTEAIGQVEAGNALHDMSGWTAYLDNSTRDVWGPLCDDLDDHDGRLAFALDLLRAAAITLDPPQTTEEPRKASTMVETLVCANDRDRYPAMVDPADQRDGYVKPWFDLHTVRRIAADTRTDARRYGHGSIDTVHVLDGTVDRAKHAVVMVVCWMWLGGDRREQAVEVLQPEAGRYAVGGHDWQWYAVSDDLTPLIPFRPEGS